MANNWAVKRLAESSLTTTHDMLTCLVNRGLNQKQIAAELGVTCGAVSLLLRRHGLKCGISLDGIRDSVSAHCRRLGLCNKSVFRIKHDFGLTDAEAIMVELGKRSRK
jgi:hypothetical protein